MSNNRENDTIPEEIDLGILFQKISNFFSNIAFSIFKGIVFIKKNSLIIIGLFITGLVAGYFLDADNNAYNNEVIVLPNFGSTDYLYSKIDLLSSKINERDYKFLKSVGIKDPDKILSIKVDPVIDIYNFVNTNTAIATSAQNTQNFELVKLLSESGDINKVIKDKLTSKNYPYHTISIVTFGFASKENTITPILNFLNNNDYFKNIRKTNVNNLKLKIQKNQEVINQIDGLLNEFSSTSNSNLKNDKLIYYNENTQLNEIIKTKTDLIEDNARQEVELINITKSIKDISTVTNIKNTKGLNGKMKFLLPLLFIFLFISIRLFKSFYKKQSAKLNK